MWASGRQEAQDCGRGLLFPAWCPEQVIEKEQPQLTECEEPSIYSPAFPREKWQRKRTQVKIRVCAQLPGTNLSHLPGVLLSPTLRVLAPYPPCLGSASGNLSFHCLLLQSPGCYPHLP